MAILTVPSEPDLVAFAGAYDLGSLESAEGIEAGTVNTSYAVTLGGRRYFLRIYEEQGPDGAAAEAALLAHLASRGVPTPVPPRGRDGHATRTLAGKPAALFPWVDGAMRCQRAVTPGDAHAVGAALARVHLAGPPPGRSLGAGRFTPEALVERCDRIAGSRDAEARRVEASLRASLLAFAAARRPARAGLVHGDLFRDNVLWERGSIAALLDFESAHDGPFAYDLAVTILSWSFGTTFDVPIARAIVDGYRTVRDLDDDERAALYDEARFACLRFTVTRITDEAIRVGKRWQRFVRRLEALDALGRRGLAEALGL